MRLKQDDIPSAFRPSLPSQLARPYLASSSSRVRDNAPVLVTFDDWDKGGIFDWYQAQRYTTIHKLELRKERDRFKHEFVVLYLDNRWACRVDRRPMGGPNTEVILSKGCEAEDSFTPLADDDIVTIQSETDVMVAVQFDVQKKLDLYTVISICVGVRMDPGCALYTLQLYNCYFLARTITALVVRHHLLRYRDLGSLRWDTLSASAISKHMFPDNWKVLDSAMKDVLIASLGDGIWPIVKKDAELLIRKRKRWLELQETTKRIIGETVKETVDNLVDAPIKTSVLRWALGATGDTLWHDDLEQNLSKPHHREGYETAVEDALMKTVKIKLNTSLPSNLVTKLDGVLPKRLLNRLPSSLLALLPVEIWARIPVHVLEKASDDTIGKAPVDILIKAPDEFLQRLPTEVLARASTPQVLTLPEDLSRVPQRLMEVALKRMSAVLEQTETTDDKSLAIKLLRRLPDDILETVPQEIRDMCEEAGDVLEECTEAVVADEPNPSTSLPSANPPHRRTPKRLILGGYRFAVRLAFDIAVRLLPRPVLAHIPGITIELIPKSMLKAISADTLARLPPEFFAGLRVPLLEKLPQELLEKLHETVLKNLPRETLEKLPDELLNRLPEKLLRNIPVELMANLPENLSDLVHQAITKEIFEGHKTTIELANRTCGVMEAALCKPLGELPDSVIRISVTSHSKMRHQQTKTLATHEELQQYILDMIRKHSKKVAQVAQLGLGEEAVYKTLRQKTEDVWRVMRPHAKPPSKR